MTLPIRYLRLTLITGFAIFAMVCVSYAHSESSPANVDTYENTWDITGGCQLTIEHKDDGVVHYKTTQSRTKFVGSEPEGDYVYLQSREHQRNLELVGGEPLKPREELTVWLRKSASGKFEPVGFEYVPNYLNAKQPGLNFNKTCLLVK